MMKKDNLWASVLFRFRNTFLILLAFPLSGIYNMVTK